MTKTYDESNNEERITELIGQVDIANEAAHQARRALSEIEFDLFKLRMRTIELLELPADTEWNEAWDTLIKAAEGLAVRHDTAMDVMSELLVRSITMAVGAPQDFIDDEPRTLDVPDDDPLDPAPMPWPYLGRQE